MSKKGTYRETDKKILADRRNKILSLYNQGCTAKQIAGYLHWPLSIILNDLQRLREQGLISEKRKKSKKVTMTNSERQTQVLKLFEKGLSYVEIAVELKVELKVVLTDVKFLREKNQIPKERKGSNLIVERRAKVLELYNQGFSYNEIAEQLNIQYATVFMDVQWLRREGQISKERRIIKPSNLIIERRAKVLELYNQGFSYKQITEQLNISTTTVTMYIKWLRQEGQISKERKKVKPSDLIIERRAKVLELYNQGFSYKQIAEHLNINEGIVSMHIQWLRREGQISKERKKIKLSNLITERRAKVLELYNQKFSYKEIAEHLNINKGIVSSDVQWLRREGKISKKRKVRKISNLNLIIERRAKVLALYNQELSYEKIAEYLNVSVATVCMDVQWLRNDEKISKKRKKVKPSNLIIERRAKVLELYNQGLSSKQMAEHLSVSVTTVNFDVRWLRYEGKIYKCNKCDICYTACLLRERKITKKHKK